MFVILLTRYKGTYLYKRDYVNSKRTFLKQSKGNIVRILTEIYDISYRKFIIMAYMKDSFSNMFQYTGRKVKEFYVLSLGKGGLRKFY